MMAWWSRRLISIAILGGACVLALSCGNDSPQPDPTPDLAATLIAYPTPAPTATPAYEGSLRVGAWARVTGATSCLEMREGAGSEAGRPINFCQPNGYEGYVVDGPFLSDGLWWWAIAGQGWAQDEYLEFVKKEDLSKRTVPALSGLGQIAYLGTDNGIWVMNADGTHRKRLINAPPSSSNTYVGLPEWRPDGQQLLYAVTTFNPAPTTYEVRVIDLDGDLIKLIPDATSAFWSPDGERLGMLHGITSTGLGSVEATPSVFDIATGSVRPIGPKLFYGEGPKWRPGAEELILRNEEGLFLAKADGSASRALTPASQQGGWVANWSPDGAKLSLSGYFNGCDGYAVYEVQLGSVSLCAPESSRDSTRGGRGGWSEDGQTDWSPNGLFFAYHTEWGLVNESGVYVVDVASGKQTLLPGWKPAFTSFDPDSKHVVFGTYSGTRNFIWVGNAETGEVTLLAEGSQPAWRPTVE